MVSVMYFTHISLTEVLRVQVEGIVCLRAQIQKLRCDIHVHKIKLMEQKSLEAKRNVVGN